MSGLMTESEQIAKTGPGSFSEFFREEYPRLCRALFLLTGDSLEAEEIAEDAMVRVYERWSRLEGVESIFAYTYTVAVNRWRRLRRRHRLSLAHATRPIDADVADIEGRTDVLAALRRLSPEQREALVLIHWLGMNAEEAASILGIRATSVRGRALRGRRVLKGLLGGQDA